LVDKSAFVVLAAPVSALHGFDDNGDGLLDLAELKAHQTDLRREVDRRLVVADGEVVGETMALDFVLSPEHSEPTGRAPAVVVLKHTTWDRPPSHVRVACDLFGSARTGEQLTMTGTRSRADGSTETEAAVLTPLSPEHWFFRPLSLALLDYLRLGAEHVLLGADHLLFLLTVIVAGAGLRYWFRVVTAFTVAHSLTLAAAMFGYVRLSPHIVEPLIALSIVLMALDNLVRKESRETRRVALVAACGLLHGLGFAASLDAMGLDGRHRIASLIGFNVGVEAGQGVFLVSVLALGFVAKKLLPRFELPEVARVLSVAAACVGSVWLVDRLVA
jgi:hydrogenase/urease accessory protein HupE